MFSYRCSLRHVDLGHPLCTNVDYSIIYVMYTFVRSSNQIHSIYAHTHTHTPSMVIKSVAKRPVVVIKNNLIVAQGVY